ncbi:hypothetical protein A3F66_04335 [candidate division TM6 bacterium RIFCSPHIGHO2_12_FULL_32_22]|nr:MAG: hypothetical protein A3F66_04335 [candidate division TM6 bacterium RIFCSPHIGHO2_12_FULL_32_22]
MNAGHFSNRTDKIDTLVMHYTVSNMARTLMHFFGDQGVVSANYIISEDGYIFKNIKKKFAAHHAGISYWNGKSKINANSLGIEHVNPGYKVYDDQPSGIRVKGSDKEWYPFTEEEIYSSIQLSKHLIEKFNIIPENIVGHSDIAPKRKEDPGPLFPWKKFAENDIGAWPNFETSWRLDCFKDAIQKNNLEKWLTEHLHIWGYKLPDEQTSAEDIIRSFQMHFRQDDISGIADLETAAILNALICNYKCINNKCPCTTLK